MPEATAAGDVVVRRPDRFGQRCLWVIVVGLALRLVLAPYTSSAYDDATWYRAAVLAWHGLGLYRVPGFSYPPLWGYWLGSIGRIARLAGVPVSAFGRTNATFSTLATEVQIFSGTITSPWFNIVVKLPLIASDLAVARIVWYLTRQFGAGGRRSTWLVALWFLNPAVIYGSAVHGAFNTIVALEILGAVALWHRRAYGAAGAVLVAGVMTKVSPAFLMPLFMVAILWRGANGRRYWRGLWRFCLCGAAAFLALLAPLALTAEIGPMLHNVFARTSGATVGGFSWLGINALSRFSWLTSWAAGPGSWVHPGAEMVDLAVSVAPCLAWMARRRQRGTEQLCALVGGALVVILLFGPLTQPQYVVWVLPVLIVLCVSSPVLVATSAALSVAMVGYVLSVVGPLGLVSPLALYTRLVPPASVAASVRAITSDPGFLGATVSKEFLSYSWLVAFPALALSFLVLGRRVFGRVRAAVPRATRAKDSGAVWARRPAVLLALGVVGLLEIFTFAPPVTEGPAHLAVAADWKRGVVDVHVSADAAAQAFHVLAVPVSSRLAIPHLYAYVDAAYPTTTASSWTAVREIANHLSAIFDVYSRHSKVHQVDAAALARLLRDLPDARHRLVVIASGDLPSSVWSATSDLVIPWMQAGGTVVWVGDVPGYYSVGKAPSFTSTGGSAVASQVGCLSVQTAAKVALDAAVAVQGPSGVGRFLGQMPRGADGRWPLSWTCVASRPTEVAQALGLEYANDHDGLPLGFVQREGGLALGYVVGGQASVAYLPEGAGRLLLFGGPADASGTTIASDTARVLLSGVMDRTGRVAWHTVRGNDDEFEVSVPVERQTTGVQLTLLDPTANGVYLRTEFLPRPRPTK